MGRLILQDKPRSSYAEQRKVRDSTVCAHVRKWHLKCPPDTIAPARCVITCPSREDTGRVLSWNTLSTEPAAQMLALSFVDRCPFGYFQGNCRRRCQLTRSAVGSSRTSNVAPTPSPPTVSRKRSLQQGVMSTLRQMLHCAEEASPHWTAKPSESVAVRM